jgi:hypothetical protein
MPCFVTSCLWYLFFGIDGLMRENQVKMIDIEGKIASYLQDCRALDSLVQENNGWHADSIAFDILDVRSREVTISVRFIELLGESQGSGIEGADRYCRLRLKMDEFGEILSAGIC